MRSCAIVAVAVLSIGMALLAYRGHSAHAAANYVVDTTSDALLTGCSNAPNDCTLRGAITLANSSGGTDTISFSIGSGIQIITPATDLPVVTDAVVIDATTQPGYSGTPLIGLNGQDVTGLLANSGLDITAGNSTVRGLAIYDWGRALFLHEGGSNIIEGNYLGIDPDGNPPPSLSGTGIRIDGSAGNTIGGTSAGSRNVISGNTSSGVWLLNSGSTGNVIAGNYIGVDPTGSGALGTAHKGVRISNADSNLIGGTSPAARNIISANDEDGIYISDGNGNRIEGNYIGTDKTGTVDLGNADNGIVIITVSPSFTASGNSIGGASPGAGNVISGNGRSGVLLTGPYTSDTVIQGNLIGLSADGASSLGNGRSGIEINGHGDAGDNQIGGNTPGARNVISGNSNGIYLILTHDNRVEGNFIGTDASASAPVASSQNGILLERAVNNQIGGISPESGNIIAFNQGNGVLVRSDSTGNSIRANSIHSNAGKGIENTSGGNHELAPPTVQSQGVSGIACANCIIDVFSDIEDEGRVYEGTTIASSGGQWTLSGLLSGPNITVTATDSNGDTSEFSQPFVCQGDCNVGPTQPPVGGSVELAVATRNRQHATALLIAISIAVAGLVTFGFALRRSSR